MPTKKKAAKNLTSGFSGFYGIVIFKKLRAFMHEGNIKNNEVKSEKVKKWKSGKVEK